MKPCGFILFLLFPFLGLFASDATPKADPAWDKLSFRIEDSRAFVGIAPVYLSVSELKPKDGYLVGTYTIRVPLKKSKNDHGKIKLPLESASVRKLGAEGGVLRGQAHSRAEAGKVNLIVCRILPEQDQAIELAITTDTRTIEFESRYTVIEKETL